MENFPHVTIVIPTYNRKKTLPRAVDSIVAQTYQNWELLIVDDCSTDDSLSIIEQSYSDERIKIVRMSQNGGANKARNEGIKISRSKYIAFLDSDDVMHPHTIQKQIEKFAKKNIGICYVGATYFSGKEEQGIVHHKKAGYLEKYLFLNLKGLGSSTSGFMVKSEVFEKVGRFDEDMASQQDLDLLVRAARFFEIDYLDNCNTKMYMNVANRISDNQIAVIEGEVMFFEKHKIRIKELGVYHHVARKLARKYALYGKDLKNAYKILFSVMKYKPSYLYAYVYALKLPILYLKK